MFFCTNPKAARIDVRALLNVDSLVTSDPVFEMMRSSQWCPPPDLAVYMHDFSRHAVDLPAFDLVEAELLQKLPARHAT